MSIPFMLVQELRDDCEEQLETVTAQRDALRLAIEKALVAMDQNPLTGDKTAYAVLTIALERLAEGENAE